MTMLTLPILFALMQSVLLFAALLLFTKKKYKRVITRELILFCSLSIVFNVCVYCEEKAHFWPCPKPVVSFLIATLILVVFILMSKQLLGLFEGRFNKLKMVSIIFSISLLFSTLTHLLCSEFLVVNHQEIYLTSLDSALLFICTLGMIFWLRKDDTIIEPLKKIALVYVFIFGIMVLSAIFRSGKGMLIFVNLQFILMIIINTMDILFEVPIKNYHRLEDFELTNRQRQVAVLIMKGLNYNQIADQLSIAENTASKHGSDIFAKTECEDRRAFYAKFFQEYSESRLPRLAEEGEEQVKSIK